MIKVHQSGINNSEIIIFILIASLTVKSLSMKKLLKDYFTFSKRERNGAVVLVLLILTVIFYPQIQSLFVTEESTDFSAFQKDIAEFEKQTSVAANNVTKKDSMYRVKEVMPVEEVRMFYFDPNKIGVAEWKQFGISEKTANTIVKYISKGGKINTANDLKKIYSLKEEDFNRIAPFVRMELKKRPAVTEHKELPKQTAAYTPKTKAKIDINLADSAMLESLYGIGSVLASRIVKFRNRLGGFFTTEQLLDVHGFKPETYDLVKEYIEVSELNIPLLSVNTVTVEDLVVNPYFRYSVAKALINYRTMHGSYQSLEEIKNCGLIDDALYEKIIPYLSL